ncbi:MAG: hypothetical protein ABEI31_08680 [Halodesulfurarchaeum sp.]
MSLDEALDQSAIHDVLSNDRRRMVLEALEEAGGPVPVRELSEYIASRESEADPPPRDLRKSVYVSLQQTHLPKLSELDIVEYDSQEKTVRPGERAGNVNVYMEVVPTYGLAWSEYYIALSVLGLLLVVASHVSVPVLSVFAPWIWATLTLGAIIISAAYQTYQQGSFILTRIRNQ